MQIVQEYNVKKTDGCWKTSGLPFDEVNIYGAIYHIRTKHWTLALSQTNKQTVSLTTELIQLHKFRTAVNSAE